MENNLNTTGSFGDIEVLKINDGIEKQENVAVEESLEFQKSSESQYTTMDEVLKKDLFLRIKQLRDAEELENFCIVDRFNSADFIYVLREALYAYREDVVIAERLFKESSCVKEPRKQYVLPPKAKELANEFAEYVKNTDFEKLSEEELKAAENKLKEYQEALKAPDMEPVLDEVYVPVFKEYDRSILVTPLKEITDSALEDYCGVLAKFVMVYFMSVRIMFKDKFKLHVASVKNGEFTDIIVMIEMQ